MRLSFDTIEEILAFVDRLKKTRGGKNTGDGETEGAQAGNAPPPLQPPTGGAAGFSPGGPAGFAPPAGGAGQAAGAFPAAGAQGGPAPETLALVQRIVAKIDWCLQPAPQGGGQQSDNILTWFRSQLGAETANYTMDQIKQVALPRAAQPVLDNIVKLMAA